MDKHTVQCYIYDISRGMAQAMSSMLLGKYLEGIWHTGIVVYGEEYFYGGGGIEKCLPGELVPMAGPFQAITLGETEIPKDIFMEYLHEQGGSRFNGARYNLFENNCNNFSDEVANFLVGRGIPEHITSLPQEILNTPFGAMIRPMIDQLQVNMDGHQLFPNQ